MSTLEREPVPSKRPGQESPTIWDDLDRLRRSKLARGAGKLGLTLGATAAAIGIGSAAGELTDPRHDLFDGSQKVTVESGDTTWSIIENNIDTKGVDIRDVVAYVMSNPDNGDVYEDGVLTPGEVLHIPEIANKP